MIQKVSIYMHNMHNFQKNFDALFLTRFLERKKSVRLQYLNGILVKTIVKHWWMFALPENLINLWPGP